MYLISLTDTERDFLLTLSPLIVSMECEIAADNFDNFDNLCSAIGCIDSSKWPHSFGFTFLCDEASAVRASPDSTRIYATIFKSEAERDQVYKKFLDHFSHHIRFQQSNYFINTHPHVYLISLTDTERDFLLTLSPLIVSMECEIAPDPDPEGALCAAIGCTDDLKWPQSFRQIYAFPDDKMNYPHGR